MGAWSSPRRAAPLLALLLVGWGDPVRDGTERGIEAYDAKRFDDALASFLRAEEEAPERPVLSFNVGAALYQLGRYEDALAAYQGSWEDPETAAASLYGAGNVLIRMQKFPEAVEMYEQALRRDPTDVDAKHNLELALKLLEHQQNQQKQDQRQQDRQNQDQQQQDEQQKNQEQKQEPDSSKTEEQDSPERKQEEPPPEAKPEENPERQTSMDKMPREEAERILSALAEEEENLRRASIEKLRERQRAMGKDW